MKLGNKIILFLVIIFLTVIVLIGYLTYHYSINFFSQYINENHLETARSIMSNIDNIMGEESRSVSSLASQILVKSYLHGQMTPAEESNFSRSLEINLSIYTTWDSITMIDRRGEEKISISNFADQTIGSEAIMERQKLFDQLSDGRLVYSDVYFKDDQRSRPVISFMAPVIGDNEEITGAVIVDVDWLEIVRSFDQFSVIHKIHLLNNQGLEILETKEEDLSYILNEKYLEADFIYRNSDDLGKYLAERKKNMSGEDYLISVIRQQGDNDYRGSGWILFTEEPQATVFSSARSITLVLVGILIMFLLAVGILIYTLLAYLVFSPIRSIGAVVTDISHGNFSAKVKYISRDEIGALVQGINSMSKNLQELHGNLEDQVRRKTADLNQHILTIENQKKSLQNTQVAIFNILEDVNFEKDKSLRLASDLEKFKLAVENASDHIVITDADGLILYANRAVAKITGFALEDILGKKAGNIDLWGGQMDAAFYKKMWEVIKVKKQVFSGEINNRRRNGEKYIAAVSVSPVLNNQGEVIFFVGIERDITKEKEADKAKTEFVSLASHQLRTPLSAINWYVEMLLAGDAGKINDEQKQYLEEVYRGNQRMVDLINALLNVSRIDLGTFAIDPELIDVSSLAKSVVKDLTPKIKAKKQKVVENYDSQVPLIKLDPKLIRIVFDNLLSNAVKYSPEKAKIEVSISKDSKNLLIKVQDNGYGIPLADQPKIFEKLFRADNIKDKETDGTGLGLYIVKAIVLAGGGQVSFESAENKGTTFNIKLPLSGMKPKTGNRELS